MQVQLFKENSNTTYVTTDYSLFKFKEGNRNKLSETHIERLKGLIRNKNLLNIRPVLVNEVFEVIDGQHRVRAAQALGVPIYYQIVANVSDEDMISLNTSKSWSIQDYLNFWCKKGNAEYFKLRNFILSNELETTIGLRIIIGNSKQGAADFRDGKFEFTKNINDLDLERCRDTIGCIKTFGSIEKKFYLNIAFWRGLLMIVQHPFFQEDVWFSNLKKLAYRVCQKPSKEEYFDMFKEIHNYHSRSRIQL